MSGTHLLLMSSTFRSTPPAGAYADDFNRADNASSVGTSSAGGKTYTQHRGTWGISTNRLYCASIGTGTPPAIVMVESDQTEGTFSYDFSVDALANYPTCIFRGVDADNYNSFYPNPGAGANLGRMVTGSETNHATVNDYGFAEDTYYTVTVTIIGNRYSIIANGEDMILDETANAAGTKMGATCFVTAANTRWDNFSVTAPVRAFTDNFTRADAPYLGPGWISGAAPTASWTIAGNKAVSTAGTGNCAIHHGNANGSVQGDILNSTGACGVIFRHSDDSNFLGINWDGTDVDLFKNVGTTYSTLITYAIATPPTVKATYSGGALELFVDGISRGTATDAFNSSASNVGLVSFNVSGEIDNFVST